MSTPEQDKLIDQYVHALHTTLTVQQAHRLTPYVAKDISFRDPRMSVQGTDGLKEAMAGLFDGTIGIVFRVIDRAWGQDGHTVYLRWDRLLKFSNGKQHAYSGMTEIMIRPDGKIASIIDHWDLADHAVPRPGLLARLRRH